MDVVNVSVIVPVYNAEEWLDQCLQSVLEQNFSGTFEVSAYDDGSTDNSNKILLSWQEEFKCKNIPFVLSHGEVGLPKGVGYAKNRAVEQSHGEYLCFLDADDVMDPLRLEKQYEAGKIHNNAIIGSRFHREPKTSTPRYTEWANSLSEQQLYTQIYTAFGPTVIMPTWFCHRSVFTDVGGFNEDGKGTPEDLLFFFEHLRKGKKLYRVNEDLLLYRYHIGAATFSVLEDTVWDIRLKELQRNVLSRWNHFTIWNAGKQGRKFYRSLSPENKKKVLAFCDVDVKKLSKGVYIYEESEVIPKPRIPIVHFSVAKPPFILCVKLQMTGGSFEENLTSLNLCEGVDYFHFS